MSMLLVALFIMATAVLHAGWNVYVKDQINKNRMHDDRLGALRIMVVTQACLGMIGWALFGFPNWLSVCYVVPSVVLQSISIALLGTGYQIDHFTKVYPMSRGATTASAFLLTAAFYAAVPNVMATLGLLAVVGGIWIIHRSELHRAAVRVLMLTLAIGVANGGAFLLDSVGSRYTEKYAYLATSFAGAGALTFIFLRFVPAAVLRNFFQQAPKSAPAASDARWRTPIIPSIIFGVIATLGWGVGVWGTHQFGSLDSVGPISALRDTNVLWGLVLAFAWLKEPASYDKWAGALLMLFGVVAITLSKTGFAMSS